ncbi:MAG: ribose-phosphate diphosphokinase, partial [Nitrosopumilus sp.]
MSQISIISGKTSEDLAKKIAKKIKANLVKSEIRIFPDGESKITLIGTISKKRSIVIQSIFPPVDTNLVHILSLITKAKENSAQVDVVIPYMGYARQDREFLPGEIVTMKVLAKLFKGAGASKITVVDIHSLIGLKYFSNKTQNVS